MVLRFCLTHLTRQSCMLKPSENSYLGDFSNSLPAFPCRANLELRNITATPKMTEKAIVSHDFPEVSDANCIPVVVLKNYEPERSYILLGLFSSCLKESSFPDFWKVALVGRGLWPKIITLQIWCKFFVKSLRSLWKTSCWTPRQIMWSLFLIWSMVLGYLTLLQIFWQLEPREYIGISWKILVILHSEPCDK